VVLKDGRTGLLYAHTQNSRNPLARDSRRPTNWYFLPDRVGTHGAVVTSQPVPCLRRTSIALLATAPGIGRTPGMFWGSRKSSGFMWLT